MDSIDGSLEHLNYKQKKHNRKYYKLSKQNYALNDTTEEEQG